MERGEGGGGECATEIGENLRKTECVGSLTTSGAVCTICGCAEFKLVTKQRAGK